MWREVSAGKRERPNVRRFHLRPIFGSARRKLEFGSAGRNGQASRALWPTGCIRFPHDRDGACVIGRFVEKVVPDVVAAFKAK